jgi:hypothetical protein
VEEAECARVHGEDGDYGGAPPGVQFPPCGDTLLGPHKDYSTTQRYINMVRQLNPVVAVLFVPDLKRSSGAG